MNKTLGYNHKIITRFFIFVFCILLSMAMFVCISVQGRVIAASAGQEIADKAKALAWPEKDKSKSTSPTTAFSEAAKAVGLDADNDCLRFVQVVILSSGVDPSFPKGEYSHNGGVDEYSTVKYMNDSSKWKKISTTNVGSLQAGDILVSAVNGVGNNHIFIYLGDGKAASANQGKWYGRIENLSEEWDPNGNSDKAFYYGDNKYQVFRIGSTDSSNSSSTSSSSKSGQQRGLSDTELIKFSQNNILFYNPGECIDPKKSSLSASGDYSEVLKAKNANESVFNVEDYSEWSAMWQDGDKEDMKKLLDNYGDLSYQLGKAIGAPWIAIIVQMKYEDPNSVCGKNNFWGNGCDPNHAYLGGATIQGENLGEGFMQYGETLSDDWYESVRGISDPKEYLEKLGPLWVQGDPNGAGYGSIEGMKASIDALQDYIDSPEGQAIVKEFGNYNESTSSSSSSDSNHNISGDDIIWIGDSDSTTAGETLLEETFPGLKNGGWGPSFNKPTSYVQACKFINSDGCGEQPNPSGLEILEKIIKEGKLRKYLVFALGGNGGWTQEDMDTFVDLIGDDTKAILTTTKYRKGDYTKSNEIVKEAAKKYTNIYVADVAAKYKDEYMDDSGIEFTDEGAKMFVQTIKEALNEANGGGCTTYDGEYPQYDQCGDPRWSNYSYSTDNICGSGCGAASMAMLATVATGQDIFPDDIAKLLGNQYYDSVSIATLDPIVGEHYGFDVEVVSTSGAEDAKTKMRDYLKKGYMIHFTGAGCYPGFIYASGGCTNGHVIGLFDIDENDMVTQANSGMGEVHQKASLDDMAHALIWGVFTAIKGGSGGKNGCSDSGLCNTSSNTTVNMDGLTEEQAQKVAEYYNNEATASNFIDGVIPSSCAKVNCVSFSYWFVSAFTDASEKGVTSGIIGDGSYIADTGLPGVGWKTGNDPTPYSIFGGAGSSAWSHTGVVVGKTDDGNILTIEAAYCQWDARVLTKSPSYFSEGVGILAYPGNHFTPNEGHLGNKSLKEIIGN